jgi:hypothetical protein
MPTEPTGIIPNFCECESELCSHSRPLGLTRCDQAPIIVARVAGIRQALCEHCKKAAAAFCQAHGYEFEELPVEASDLELRNALARVWEYADNHADIDDNGRANWALEIKGMLEGVTLGPRKTRHQIEELKRAWLADPEFDLETIEGFEAHRQELYIYRLEQENRWLEIRRKQAWEQLQAIGKALAPVIGTYISISGDQIR